MINTENLMEIQLSLSSPTYRGPKGDKPVKGVDYFTQEDINDIVSQIETDGYATKEYVDNAVSGVVVSETDPTVPAWAKQANKPSYTASEVGALPADTQLFSGSYNDLSNKPTIPEVPTNVSAFNNDAGYLTDVEFHDTMNKTTVSVNDVGLYVETLDNEQNPVYRTDVIDIGVQANGPSGGVGIGNGQLIFVEPTNGNMLEVTIDENGDSLYVNGDKVALVNDIPNLTGYATESYVDDAIANIPAGGITVETDPTVPSWAKQANKPTYTAQEVGALPANTELFSGNYEDLTNKPTLPPTPIVIQATIAGQPSVVDSVYTVPLTITSNNMAEAYAQYQTHPSIVGMAVDLTALGRATKMYLDCESFYRYGNDDSGYTYETFGEFNDSSFSQSFGFEFQNINVRLSTKANDSYGTVIGVATVNQLASKANSADLATVATSGDYNDLTNKPTIPTAYTLPTATTSTLGGVKVDGSTITIDGNGVISSSASGGSNYTFTNGLTERDGTVSWNLNSRIKAGTSDYSVAIGNGNIVSGIYAFAEGSSNQATGLASHAEGQNTKAWGVYSHAEGSNTIASTSYQHVEGKYNVEDSNSIFQNIAGNGSSARSTMFARDWNGNEYLSGNLFVGCNDFTTTANGLTTANAGGSKVATESYVATAIANIPSGGSSYTAGQGISIDNGEISLDFGNEIENGSFSFTQHYDNEDYYKYTSYMYPNEINITSYGEADPETGDQETKSISITGEGITFDDTGDTHTLGVSNGELVFDDNPIGSGGGSSYTAGNGIDIDSNNVIKLRPLPIFQESFISNVATAYNPYLTSAQGMSWEQFLEALRQGKIVTTNNASNLDWIDTGSKMLDASTIIGDANAKFYVVKLFGTTAFNFWEVSSRALGNMAYYFDGVVLYMWQSGSDFTNWQSVMIGNTTKKVGEVLNDFNTRIPTAPTTDGNYVLKVSVSSGTPTYSWEEVTVGGSY